MSVPCIFTPFIKAGGEVVGERQKEDREEKRGKVTVRSRDKQREGNDEEKRGREGERGIWKGTISMC